RMKKRRVYTINSRAQSIQGLLWALSGSLKALLNLSRCDPQDDRATMRAGGRVFHLQQFVDQPARLFGRQLHVDLDRRAAGQPGGDLGPQFVHRQSPSILFNRVEQFGEQRLRRARGEHRRDSLDRDRAARQSSELEAVLFQLRQQLIERRGLRRRQIDGVRDQHPLDLDPFASERAPVPFEQYALVRDVLVDQQQPGAVRRDDEAVVQLTDRVDLVGDERQVLRGFELRGRRVGAARAQAAYAI